jgi:hypothetical protein
MLVDGGALIFGIVVWGALFWGAIYLLDRENPHNFFIQALLVSVVRVAVAFVTAFGSYAGLGALAAWLVLMMRILLNYYELGIAKSFAVVVLMIAVPYAVAPALADWVGDNEIRGALVLYGLPASIISTWLYLRHRAANHDDSIPQARVVTDLPAVPIAPSAPPAAMQPPAAVRTPEPEPAPPKTITPVAPVRSSAPMIVEQASAEDGPKFLT